MSFPRVCVAAAILTGAVLCEASLAQQVVQLPLPYNADVVREVGGTISGGGIDPAQPDPGGRGLVTQSEAAANDAVDPRGLPDDGVLAVPGGTIQLGPYNGNNAVRLASFGTSADNVAFGVPVLGGVLVRR